MDSLNDEYYADQKGNDGVDKFLEEQSEYVKGEMSYNKYDVYSVLNIDWKSLMHKPESQQQIETNLKTSCKTLQSNPFKKKNSALSMLNSVGFIPELAGEALSKQLEEQMKTNLGDDYEPILHPNPILHAYYRDKKLKERDLNLCEPLNGFVESQLVKRITNGLWNSKKTKERTKVRIILLQQR